MTHWIQMAKDRNAVPVFLGDDPNHDFDEEDDLEEYDFDEDEHCV